MSLNNIIKLINPNNNWKTNPDNVVLYLYTTYESISFHPIPIRSFPVILTICAKCPIQYHIVLDPVDSSADDEEQDKPETNANINEVISKVNNNSPSSNSSKRTMEDSGNDSRKRDVNWLSKLP